MKALTYPLFALTWLLSLASPALGGIPECNDLRLEDFASCRVDANVGCDASCSDIGIYKMACATQLRTVCKTECTLPAEASCTDSCTETCTQRCDAGENITCQHNCFGECSGSCADTCRGAADVEQCYAVCEANCDGECDTKCKPLVNGSCYEHCIECCGGSCNAQANMVCQESCQEEKFEDCEYELRLDCDASCSAEGALFCKGAYALSGSDVPRCATALLAEGVDLGDYQGAVDAQTEASLGCAVGSARRFALAWPFYALGVGLLGLRMRRANRVRP